MTQFENVPDKEAERIANTVKLTLDRLDKRFPGTTPVRRGVHPKDHGCVTARFKVAGFTRGKVPRRRVRQARATIRRPDSLLQRRR